MKATTTLPSIERLHELFICDPEAGKLINRAYRNPKAKAGEEAGTLQIDSYCRVSIDRKKHKTYRVIWAMVHGYWPTKQIDHINNVKTDNRLCNLREATQAENNRNSGRQSNNTSGAKGVSWYKCLGKWKAKANIDGRHHYLGIFADRDVAATVYNFVATQVHGEFCHPSVRTDIAAEQLEALIGPKKMRRVTKLINEASGANTAPNAPAVLGNRPTAQRPGMTPPRAFQPHQHDLFQGALA